MFTITNTFENELIIKNSRFITILTPVFDVSDVSGIIDIIKLKYPKATHYCYACITTSQQKFSDDGEPGSTAGAPMLNVLTKNNTINILAVTVRYFGGIKLGAGGLVRAYSKSVSEALQVAELLEVEEGYKIEVIVSYDNQKNLEYLLRNFKIVDKKYLDFVTYTVLLPKSQLSLLEQFDFKLINEEYIEKSSF